jgi:ABC-type transport system substrate-binding protein
MDPINSNDIYSAWPVAVTYEGLYQYQYLKRPLSMEPLLADGMPQVSKDGLTFTIKIKKGVRFQDDAAFPGGKGRELNAQDVIYSWKRLSDPANQSEGFWVFDGHIKGLNEWRDKMGKGEVNYETVIDGMQALDKQTVVIKLTKPYFQLLYQLASPYTSVVPKEAVEKYGKEFVNHPVGTGPYILAEWIRNSRLTFVRNPNWHGETYPTEGDKGDEEAGFLADAGKVLPFADKINFYELQEDQPRWLKFMKGETDWVEIPKDNFEGSVKNKKIAPDAATKGIWLAVDSQSDEVFISFNMMDPILGKNALVRRAINLAFDTDTLLDKFYNGRGVVAQSQIAVGLDGYDPNFKNPYKQHNVAKAKEFLAKAGYPDGKGFPELEYDCPSSTTERQMGEYLQQQLAQIGIKINIQQFSWSQFNERMKERKMQMFGYAWMADYPDAENFLQLLYGPNASPGNNNSNYQNAAYDKLYDQAAKLPPGPERTAIYKKMRDIFVEDAPWVPTINRFRYQLVHGWVKNFKVEMAIVNYLKYLRVDMNAKKDLKAKL